MPNVEEQPSCTKDELLTTSSPEIVQVCVYAIGVDCLWQWRLIKHREEMWCDIQVHDDVCCAEKSWSRRLTLYDMSFGRFVFRKRKPFELLSDHWTNFTYDDFEQKQAFPSMKPVLKQRIADQRVWWHFNFTLRVISEASGREITSLKHGFKVVLRVQTVTEPVLQTLLIEVEVKRIPNSKPMGYVSNDASVIDPIKQNLLLRGIRDPSLPQIVYPVSKLMGLRRWRHCQFLTDQFWSHFTMYYLPDMQIHQK